MGTDNIDIVVNELDAVANIDFERRIPKAGHRTLNLIRIGTSGALQADIDVDTCVASRYAVGLDGLAYFYKDYKSVIDNEMTNAFINDMNYPTDLPKPYIVESSEELFNRLSEGFHKGITATSPGFYGPQGRSIRAELNYPNINNNIEKFKFKEWRITNFEMESSALFMLAKILGHNALTICAIAANRVLEKFSPNYHPTMEKLILNVLDRI